MEFTKVTITQQPDSFSVDRNAGKITGLSLGTVGEALGHWADFDATTLKQIVDQFAVKERIKARFGHPEAFKDPIGTEVGYFENPRLNGEKALADFVAIPTEYNKAALDHLFKFAEAGKSMIGISIEAYTDRVTYSESGDDREYVRIKSLEAAAFVSDPSANPDGLFSQKINPKPKRKFMKPKNPILRLFAAIIGESDKFADAELPDGTVVRFPGETPELGDPIVVVEGGEEVGAAPDGDHQVGGMIITVSDGIISGISMAEKEPVEAEEGDKDEKLAEIPAAEKTEAAKKEPVKTYKTPKTPEPEMSKETEELQRQLDEMKAAFAKLAGEPADNFDLGKADFSINKGKAKQVDAVLEGFKNLQDFKAESRYAGKKLRTRSATRQERFDFVPEAVVIPALREFEGLMQNFVYLSNIEDTFTLRRASVDRDASTVVTLPTLYDTGLTLNDGQVCSPTNDGESNPDGRQLTVRQYHARRVYCTRNGDFARFLDRLVVADKDSIPYEAMIIDQMLRQFTANWEGAVWLGNAGAINGIIPQLVADAAVVGSPANATPSTYTAANFNIGTGDPITEMTTIAQDIQANAPRILQLQQSTDMRWNAYQTDIEAYWFDRGVEQNANGDLALVQAPPLMSGAQWVPTYRLENIAAVPRETYHVVTPRENMFIYTSDRDSGLFGLRTHFNESTFNLEITVEGHLGVGYARSQDVFMSVGS